MPKRVLLTGASGFIGRKLLARLAAGGYNIRVAERAKSSDETMRLANSRIYVGDIGPLTDWLPALENIDLIVHLAAQTPDSAYPPGVFERVNAEATRRLAQQATQAGVGKFVLISSVLAVADNSSAYPITDATPSRATSIYGQSKLAAETSIAAFAQNGGIGISLRPPLVYDAAAGGNWRLLQKMAALPIPLPFRTVRNHRSLISRDNLIDAIIRAVNVGDNIASGAYAVAESETTSLANLIAWLRIGMGRPQWLVAAPTQLLRVMFKALGRSRAAESLLGDLVIDSSRFRKTFGWREPFDTRSEIISSGEQFKANSR